MATYRFLSANWATSPNYILLTINRDGSGEISIEGGEGPADLPVKHAQAILLSMLTTCSHIISTVQS